MNPADSVEQCVQLLSKGLERIVIVLAINEHRGHVIFWSSAATHSISRMSAESDDQKCMCPADDPRERAPLTRHLAENHPQVLIIAPHPRLGANFCLRLIDSGKQNGRRGYFHDKAPVSFCWGKLHGPQIGHLEVPSLRRMKAPSSAKPSGLLGRKSVNSDDLTTYAAHCYWRTPALIAQTRWIGS